MKIAFCFLTWGDLLQPKVWEAFFAGAAREKYSVYCHPKEPEQVTGPILSGRMIDNTVPTRHGHISLVEAALNLFSHAYHDAEDNEYFVLLSESTIPIVSFDEFYKDVERCGPNSVFGYSTPETGSEHHQRLSAVKHATLFSSPFFLHDQWVILHRRHVSMLLNKPGLSLFSEVFAPDEHYCMNALVHLKGASLDQFVNRRGTFVNWRDWVKKSYINRETGEVIAYTAHPKTYCELSAADIAEARALGCWFFRKLDAACDCAVVLRHLEGELAAT